MEVNAIWPMTTTLNCKGYMPDFKFGAQSVKSTDNFRVIFFFSDSMEIKEIETISVLALV